MFIVACTQGARTSFVVYTGGKNAVPAWRIRLVYEHHRELAIVLHSLRLPPRTEGPNELSSNVEGPRHLASKASRPRGALVLPSHLMFDAALSGYYQDDSIY